MKKIIKSLYPFVIACLIANSVIGQNINHRSKNKPNIVLILADDLGYGDLQCYGTGKIPTPNCDKMADEGLMFTDVHSPSAVCSPTRYGILTGNYA